MGTPPFASGPLMFAHNGAVEDFRRTAVRVLRDSLSEEAYADLLGTTDSETIFAGLLDLLREDPANPGEAIDETIQHVRKVCTELGVRATLNLRATDGERMAFARYSPEGPGDSLYFVEDGQAFSHMGGCGLRAPGQRRGVAGDAGPASASRG